MGLNVMLRKHIFGAQIENNMSENHVDLSKRNGSPLFITFFMLLQRAR